VVPVQGDIREINLGESTCDIILASAVLHHLRTDAEWEAVFKSLYLALRPQGSIWIFDLVESSIASVETLMRQRWGEYLTNFKGEEYRDQVFQYVAVEDTPQSLMYQLELLRRVGFSKVDVLHKISCFAAFGAVKE
jgi:tRNA (cmo5U34)-methyltransferase